MNIKKRWNTFKWNNFTETYFHSYEFGIAAYQDYEW